MNNKTNTIYKIKYQVGNKEYELELFTVGEPLKELKLVEGFEEELFKKYGNVNYKILSVVATVEYEKDYGNFE